MRIAYVGPFRFPDNNAAARRVQGVASTLCDLGHEVIVASASPRKQLSCSQTPTEYPFQIEHVWRFPERSASIRSKIRCALSWGKETAAWLKRLHPKPDVVFVYEYPHFKSVTSRIAKNCRSSGIAIIEDVVEWYQPSHLRLGWGGPFHVHDEYLKRCVIPRTGNVVAISKYLERYYTRKQCNVLRMPPTIDTDEIVPRLEASEGPLRMAYAGYIGKKDLIENVIEAIWRLDPLGQQFRLIMAGPSEADVLRLPPCKSRGAVKLPPFLEVRGALPHGDVIDLVRQADFVPLLRKPERFAMAGFPTKVPESMSLGTPILCNLTSDLGDHVRDGMNGIHCLDYSTEACQQALKRACELSVDERTAMRLAARSQAEQDFDYRRFVDPMARFLERIST